MKIFLDTANVDDIRHAADLGVLDGVTTNPSLVSKEKGSFESILREIAEICPGPVSAEVVSTNVDGMMEEGERLAAIAPNIVVKIPMIAEGLKAIRRLSEKEIAVNCTLIFNPTQALLASKAGATFVSPFLGRLDDIGHVGMELVAQIVTIFDNYAIETEVLAASLRHPLHIVEAAIHGADAATMPYKVFDQLIKHPLTDIGLEKFLADWKKVEGR